MLTEMDDLFDVNDFDLCVGCCPHGQASGFLGNDDYCRLSLTANFFRRSARGSWFDPRFCYTSFRTV